MAHRKAKRNLNGPGLKDHVKYKTEVYNSQIEFSILDHCVSSIIEAPEVPTAA